MLPEIQMPDSETQMLTLPQMTGNWRVLSKNQKIFIKKNFFLLYPADL
jgi:hypothetical protein